MRCTTRSQELLQALQKQCAIQEKVAQLVVTGEWSLCQAQIELQFE